MGGPDQEGLESVARPPDDENWHIIFKPVDCPGSCSEKGLVATKTVLPGHLSEAPMLAALVGSCTRGMLNALDLVRQPALALDWIGYVVDTNASAAPCLATTFGWTMVAWLFVTARRQLRSPVSSTRLEHHRNRRLGCGADHRPPRWSPLSIDPRPADHSRRERRVSGRLRPSHPDRSSDQIRSRPGNNWPSIWFDQSGGEARDSRRGRHGARCGGEDTRDLARDYSGSAEGSVRQNRNSSAERTPGAALSVGLLIAGAGCYRPRRTRRPGLAPVCSPSSNTGVPATNVAA
jgi:hypothetical protein